MPKSGAGVVLRVVSKSMLGVSRSSFYTTSAGTYSCVAPETTQEAHKRKSTQVYPGLRPIHFRCTNTNMHTARQNPMVARCTKASKSAKTRLLTSSLKSCRCLVEVGSGLPHTHKLNPAHMPWSSDASLMFSSGAFYPATGAASAVFMVPESGLWWRLLPLLVGSARIFGSSYPPSSRLRLPCSLLGLRGPLS